MILDSSYSLRRLSRGYGTSRGLFWNPPDGVRPGVRILGLCTGRIKESTNSGRYAVVLSHRFELAGLPADGDLWSYANEPRPDEQPANGTIIRVNVVVRPAREAEPLVYTVGVFVGCFAEVRAQSVRYHYGRISRTYSVRDPPLTLDPEQMSVVDSPGALFSFLREQGMSHADAVAAILKFGAPDLRSEDKGSPLDPSEAFLPEWEEQCS